MLLSLTSTSFDASWYPNENLFIHLWKKNFKVTLFLSVGSHRNDNTITNRRNIKKIKIKIYLPQKKKMNTQKTKGHKRYT